MRQEEGTVGSGTRETNGEGLDMIKVHAKHV